MSHHPERRELPLIAVYGETAAKAEQRVTELLGAAGASPPEVHTLIAAIQAGAVEGAQGEVIELDLQAPSSSSDQVHEGWFHAVEAIADRHGSWRRSKSELYPYDSLVNFTSNPHGASRSSVAHSALPSFTTARSKWQPSAAPPTERAIQEPDLAVSSEISVCMLVAT
jgi:hypothetical protein